MTRFAEVTHPQWIRAPLETVRAQFADLDHHIHQRVHPHLQFEVLERHAQGVRFRLQGRLLGRVQRDVFERRLLPDGAIEDLAVQGSNRGGSVRFSFRPGAIDGRDGTHVEITVRLPLPPLLGVLVRPLFEAQIRRQVEVIALEDRVDIEGRGYPRRAAVPADAWAVPR